MTYIHMGNTSTIIAVKEKPLTKTRPLYVTIDGSAGAPTNNTPSSDGVADFHQTVPILTVQVYSPPEPPIWHQFGCNLEPVLK